MDDSIPVRCKFSKLIYQFSVIPIKVSENVFFVVVGINKLILNFFIEVLKNLKHPKENFAKERKLEDLHHQILITTKLQLLKVYIATRKDRLMQWRRKNQEIELFAQSLDLCQKCQGNSEKRGRCSQ